MVLPVANRSEVIQRHQLNTGAVLLRMKFLWPAAIAILCLGAGHIEAAAPASPGKAVLLEAGESYAAGDVTAALAKLDEIIRRGGKTIWEQEALFLRAKIVQKDAKNLEGALRDLRTLSIKDPTAPAAAFGLFRIARLYEEAGALEDAYREYTTCARLRISRTDDIPPEPWSIPTHRIRAASAAQLIARAAFRAARLLHRLPDSAAREHLPPRTFVVVGASGDVEIPPDLAQRPAPQDRMDVWYIVAPAGAKIGEVSVEFSAAVDPGAAGVQAEKGYSLVIEPLRFDIEAGASSGSNAGVLAFSGTSTAGQSFTHKLAIKPPAGLLRLMLYRNGARALKCELKIRPGTQEDKGTPIEPDKPSCELIPASPPCEASAGGPSLVQTEGRFLLVYHSPGPAGPDEPDEDADIYMTSSADGRSWEAPERLDISSACEDRDPTLAVLADGRLLLAWTSDRRASGARDIYTSESRDGRQWTRPRRLAIPQAELESIGPRTHVTFHVPALHVDSSGRIRLFFVAMGFREDETRTIRSGLYGIASTDGRLWSSPVALVSTPQVHLDRWKPAPKGEGRETVSYLARPSIIELSPGRLAVAWVSSWGRVFLSLRDASSGRWSLEDLKVAGLDTNTAARAAHILGPLAGGRFGLLLSRRDAGAFALWPEGDGWQRKTLGLLPPSLELGSPTAVLIDNARWLTAWSALRAEGMSCIYVRELSAPSRPNPQTSAD